MLSPRRPATQECLQETHKHEWQCTFPTPFQNTHAELRFKVTILPGIPSFTFFFVLD